MRLNTSKFSSFASAGMLSVSAMFIFAAPVYADKPVTQNVHKSYVCKYVGKPGVDERLQTGQNPIWVDNHSLTAKSASDVKVGDTFSDAQVKSVVIVANSVKLNPEPSVSDCPAPKCPPATPVTPVMPTPTPAPTPVTPPVGRGGTVLGASTTAPVAANAATLPNTGVSTLTTSLISLLILAVTVGIVSYRPKHVA
jgi:hypothetical protein